MATAHKQARTLAQDARALRTLKLKKKKAKDAYDQAAKAHDEAERALMERMDAEEVESIRSAGVLFSPTRTTYSTVQDPAAFFAWAREHHPELIDEQKHHKGQLHDLVRCALEDEEPLPPGVGWYVDEYVSQRAA